MSHCACHPTCLGGSILPIKSLNVVYANARRYSNQEDGCYPQHFQKNIHRSTTLSTSIWEETIFFPRTSPMRNPRLLLAWLLLAQET